MSDGKSKSKIPYFIVAFFLVFITVDIYYVYLAKRTWTGIVTENSYQKGLDYNETLDALKKQKELGWELVTSVEDLGGYNRLIGFTLKDSSGKNISDAKIEVFFKRPVRQGNDFKAQASNIDGKYNVRTSFSLPGRWQAQILVSKDDQTYRKVEELYIKPINPTNTRSDL